MSRGRLATGARELEDLRLNGYQIIPYITEEEMWQLRNDKPDAKGVPKFYTVTRTGNAIFWPKLDPQTVKLMCAEGVI